MFIRTIIIITIFTASTLLGGCQKDSQESDQSPTDATSSYESGDKTDQAKPNKQRLYMIRIGIVQALIPTSRIKMAVSDYHANTGQFAGAAETIDNLPPNISVDNVTGRITVQLKDIDNSLSKDDIIQLTPEISNSGISWRCESHTIADLTPPGCQDK